MGVQLQKQEDHAVHPLKMVAHLIKQDVKNPIEHLNAGVYGDCLTFRDQTQRQRRELQLF